MKRNTDRRKRKGFTLIELMIVISIIAILMAIAIPNFVKYREEQRMLTEEHTTAILEEESVYYDGNVAPKKSGIAPLLIINRGNGIKRYYDAELKVACYTAFSDGISCVQVSK